MRHIILNIASGLGFLFFSFHPAPALAQTPLSWSDAHEWISAVRDLCLAESSATPIGPGWQRSRTDVNRVLPLVPHVLVRDGFTLRAYVRNDDANAIARVVALPTNAAYPTPDESMIAPDGSLQIPNAISLDRAIHSDGTPEGYLQTALLIRELGDFGSRWHGTVWNTNALMTRAAWPGVLSTRQGIDTDGRRVDLFGDFFSPSDDPNEWRWKSAPGAILDFAPTLNTLPNQPVTLRFVIYKAIGGEEFVAYTETFDNEGYRFQTNREVLATGPRTVVF